MAMGAKRVKAKVYVETSVFSYLGARTSRSIVAAAHQAITAEWWDGRRGDFELYSSALVLREAQAGDSAAAARRMEFVRNIPLLELTEAVTGLAEVFLQRTPLPASAGDDAVHIALATVHGMDYLLTWNCRHIANAQILRVIGAVAEAEGYAIPVICTPEELLGEGVT